MPATGPATLTAASCSPHRDTRCSTRRSRRQAAIRSVIVTLAPLQVLSKLEAKGGSSRRYYTPEIGQLIVV